MGKGDIEFMNREKVMNSPGKMPGYAGYIPSIKPENLYSKTFMHLTTQVDDGSFYKGTDHPCDEKYHTTNKLTYTPKTIPHKVNPQKNARRLQKTHHSSSVDIAPTPNNLDNSFNSSQTIGDP
jgi:hypothetical protein